MRDKQVETSDVNRIYSAVIDTVRRISGEEPVIFQRDGRLIAASRNGYGIVNYGLPTDFTDWERRSDYKKDEPEPEARKYSFRVRVRAEDPGRSSNLAGDDDILRYFQPLIRNPDGCGITIEDMAILARDYSKLPADGRTRMVNHSSGYHSHKHGYAVDGIDVVPTLGRTISMEKYLELMERTEEDILERINTEFGEIRGSKHRTPDAFDVYGDYCNSRLVVLPDAFVLTPNLFVSFLRPGKLNTHKENVNHWDRSTEISTGPDVYFRLPGSYEESPFKMNVTINSRDIGGGDVETFRKEEEKIAQGTSRELLEIETTVGLMEPVLTRLNGLHNKLFF